MIQRWSNKCQIWKIEDDVRIRTSIKGIEYEHDYLRLDQDGSLLIKNGYAWNGCSPKFLLLGMVFGTPEGALPTRKEKSEVIKNLHELDICRFSLDKPKTYYASLVHDALYQIAEKENANMSKDYTDRLFFSILKAYRFKPAKIYYLAVKVFGKFCWGKISI